MRPVPPLDRPRVEVRHDDGRWYPGRLHGWVRRTTGRRAVVSYLTAPGLQFYACVPARRVRPAPDDRADDPW